MGQRKIPRVRLQEVRTQKENGKTRTQRVFSQQTPARQHPRMCNFFLSQCQQEDIYHQTQ